MTQTSLHRLGPDDDVAVTPGRRRRPI